MPAMWAAVGIGGLGAIGGGFGAAAANQNAINQWVQGELQKGINNGKAIADAVYNESQKAKSNRAIRLGAWSWEQEQRDRVEQDSAFEAGVQHRTMVMAAAQTKSALAHRGITGGTAAALERQNLMNGYAQVKMMERNRNRKFAEIAREAERMHNQVNLGVFIPNIQGPSAAPVPQSEILAGLASGVQIGLGAYSALK